MSRPVSLSTTNSGAACDVMTAASRVEEQAGQPGGAGLGRPVGCAVVQLVQFPALSVMAA